MLILEIIYLSFFSPNTIENNIECHKILQHIEQNFKIVYTVI